MARYIIIKDDETLGGIECSPSFVKYVLAEKGYKVLPA
jgi:hypothetical protein